jgi:hypothetical protein
MVCHIEEFTVILYLVVRKGPLSRPRVNAMTAGVISLTGSQTLAR